MSEKGRKRRKIVRFFAGFLISHIICGLIVLIVWAILQPKKPRFVLQDATVFNFNVSAPNLLSSQMQLTIHSHNPNDKISVYYGKLDTYATYHSQQITYHTTIPPAYQGHKDSTVWSPFVYGTNVPVAPYNGAALTQDQSGGEVALTIRLDGHVKWKVGSLVTGWYHIHVTCLVYIPFGNESNGLYIGSAVRYQLEQRCSVGL